MYTFLHAVDYPAITSEHACHTEIDFVPQSIKAHRAKQSKRSVCLLRVCEVRCGGAHSGLLGRPPERERACTPVLCLVNSAIVARSRSIMLSLPIWRAIRCLSLIGSDCSHSGQLGAPALQQRAWPRCTAAAVPGWSWARRSFKGIKN